MAVLSLPTRGFAGKLLGMNHSDDSAGRQNEGSLLALVARGDRSAPEQLLARYQGLVWSLARRACPTEADAEDATQEIFLDVWKSAARFDGSIASEATFIAMIARRRLIDRQRRSGRRPQTEVIVEDAASCPEPDPELPQADRETAAMAREAMDELSADQQKVLQLSIFHGHSHEKIASSTGMPLGTVKTHARRGLIKLRGIMETKLRSSDSDTQGVIA